MHKALDSAFSDTMSEALKKFVPAHKDTLIESGIYRRVKEALLPTHQNSFRLLNDVKTGRAEDPGEAVKDMYAIVNQEVRRQALDLGIPLN